MIQQLFGYHGKENGNHNLESRVGAWGTLGIMGAPWQGKFREAPPPSCSQVVRTDEET